jgi:sugar lactone lactonase YvrE
MPTILLSSGVPIAINESGDLFYAPFTREGPLEIVKRGRNQESVLARVERGADGGALHWINGITSASDGTVYFTENAALRKVSTDGRVSIVVSGLTRDNVPPVPGIRAALGPYLRGLSIDGARNIWVAATGNCSVLKISPAGKVSSVLRTESPWSPTGVAVAGDDIYVLEYLHTATDNREDWLPRVIKRSADGRLQTVATLDMLH